MRDGPHTVISDSGRLAQLRQAAVPIRTDTALVLWAFGTMHAFPVDTDGFVDDDTIDELAEINLLITADDEAIISAGATLIATQLTETVDLTSLESLLAPAGAGPVLELGSRTDILSSTLPGRDIERVDGPNPHPAPPEPGRRAATLTQCDLATFARTSRYRSALLVQRPTWPLSSRAEIVALIENLTTSIAAGGMLLTRFDPKWPRRDLLTELNDRLRKEQYAAVRRDNQLTGLRSLVLIHTPDDEGSTSQEVATLETQLSPAAGPGAALETHRGWAAVEYLDDDLRPAPNPPGAGQPYWIRAHKAGDHAP